MNGVRIDVLAVEEKKGVSKATQKPYAMVVCQAVVYQADGKIAVGELVLPKDHPEVKPGSYDATFTVQVGFDKKITGAVQQLTPLKLASVPAAGAK